MAQLTVIASDRIQSANSSRDLAGFLAVRALGLEDLSRHDPEAFTFFDIDLDNPAYSDEVRNWLRRRPKDGMALFAVDKRSRIQTVRAYSIGATDIVYRPVRSSTLLSILFRNRHLSRRVRPANELECSCGVVAGISALQDLFTAATTGVPLNPSVIADAGETLAKHIEHYGFADWVQAIRIHHDQTYQHCLLVAGAAAKFAQDLGFNTADRRRVAMAGLLHDTGKIMIPVSILMKPQELDESELATVRQHPKLGHAALQSSVGLHPEMLDMVLHHHELLDGSGYPDRLGRDEISDLTRIVTIADIFSALIERRAYRPPMSGDAAYQVLLDMGTKLDHALVRAFAPLSRVRFELAN